MNKSLQSGFAAAILLALSAASLAHPVVYKLTTVTDGMIGSLPFGSAVVTIEMNSDTRGVTTTTVAGATVYENAVGSATLTVSVGGTKIVTEFLPGQIFARYDITNGIVGFGSPVGPMYPFAIDCGSPSCSGAGDWGPGWIGYSSVDGIAAALADPSTDAPDVPSNYTLNLPANLSQSTLLTGYVSACAAYVNGWNCAAPPAVLLQTRYGSFYVQDMSGENQVGLFKVTRSSED